MAVNIRETINKERKMARESMYGKMEAITTEIGLITK
jgi:hypothetical protein